MKNRFFLGIFILMITFTVTAMLALQIPGIGNQKPDWFINVVIAIITLFSGFTRFFNSESMQKYFLSNMAILGILSAVAIVCHSKQASDTAVYYGFFGFLSGIILGRIANHFSASKPKRIFVVGEMVQIIKVEPLPGNDKAPAVQLGRVYQIREITVDSQGNQHLDLGISSTLNYVRSYETKEHLPNGNKIHWVHPSRVK